MKRIQKIKYLLIIVFTVFALNNFAQGGPGDPGGSPEGGNDPLGGGAPLSGGTLLLITIGAVYGSKKVFDLKNKSEKYDS